ncbi:hypothetical protein DYB30_002922 [Aphanomyces astaci]|uniref:AAA+ ATPase domain-containing protein n=1 Tax=Aphanomyces astaci TaxID=112090 RepID=A0A397DPM0_APHAT|nr:hypothetical protein DYB30_002922 [Aphanomyces astaci]
MVFLVASSFMQVACAADSEGTSPNNQDKPASSWDDISDKLKVATAKGLSKLSWGLEWLGYKSGFGEQCTFSSNLLAEALFKWTKRLDHSDKDSPSGLLVFRGEDFSDNYTNPVSQYQEQIKSRLAEHLFRCSGKALVVFDEVQKVIPHTLDVLTSAMSSNAHLTYHRGGVERRIDTADVVFLLISDIGVAKMEQLLIQYDDRRHVPATQLENDVKRALDAQWTRLQFGKMVRQVVPFLPFEPQHIVLVIQAKLDQLSEYYQGVYWKSLAFDPALAPHLSTLESMLYIERRAVVRGVDVRKVFAKYGARNVETGPLQQLKSKLMRYARPWNPEAQFTVRLMPDERTIEIVACVEARANDQDKANEDGGGGAIDTLSCVSRWQGEFT